MVSILLGTYELLKEELGLVGTLGDLENIGMIANESKLAGLALATGVEQGGVVPLAQQCLSKAQSKCPLTDPTRAYKQIRARQSSATQCATKPVNDHVLSDNSQVRLPDKLDVERA